MMVSFIWNSELLAGNMRTTLLQHTYLINAVSTALATKDILLWLQFQ